VYEGKVAKRRLLEIYKSKRTVEERVKDSIQGKLQLRVNICSLVKRLCEVNSKSVKN